MAYNRSIESFFIFFLLLFYFQISFQQPHFVDLQCEQDPCHQQDFANGSAKTIIIYDI